MFKILKKIIKNKLFYCFAFLIILMLPSTLYMQSDNNLRLVVTTIGIDRNESGEYEVTTLAVIPKVSTDVNANLEIFSGKGKTITSALQQIEFNTGKDIGLAHCDCIIISNDFQNDNIAEILDYFIRTGNLTSNAILAASDQKSKDLIEVTKNSNNLLDLSLRDVISYQITNSMLENTSIDRFYKTYFTKSSTFFLPVISLEESQSSDSNNQGGNSGGDSDQSSSTNSSNSNSQKKIKSDQKVALIQYGKFVRELTEDEIYIYNIISQTSQSLNIEVPDINDQYVTNSFEIYQQVNKILLPIYHFREGKPVVTYEVWLNIMLEEIISPDNCSYAAIDSTQNFLSDDVKNTILNTIEDKRKNTMNIMRNEKNDILDLYAKFNAYKHSEFKKYLESLDDSKNYLEKMDVELNIHLDIVI